MCSRSLFGQGDTRNPRHAGEGTPRRHGHIARAQVTRTTVPHSSTQGRTGEAQEQPQCQHKVLHAWVAVFQMLCQRKVSQVVTQHSDVVTNCLVAEPRLHLRAMTTATLFIVSLDVIFQNAVRTLPEPLRGALSDPSLLCAYPRFSPESRALRRGSGSPSCGSGQEAAVAHKANVLRRRHRQLDSVEKRAEHAQALVELGELSSARQALEGATCAPGCARPVCLARLSAQAVAPRTQRHLGRLVGEVEERFETRLHTRTP